MNDDQYNKLLEAIDKSNQELESRLDGRIKQANQDLESRLTSQISDLRQDTQSMDLKLFNEVQKVNSKVGLLAETSASKSDIDHIVGVLDRMRALLDTDEVERGAQNVQLDQHEQTLTEHETQLNRLEKRLA